MAKSLVFNLKTESTEIKNCIDDILDILRGVIKDSKVILRIKLCLYEALANSFCHGNRGEQTKNILVEVEIASQSIIITIEDEGKGILLDHELKMPLPFREKGRGLVFIKENCDNLILFQDKGKIQMCFEIA